SFHAPCPPLRTGCVSPLRKNVPSEENVSRFLPTPLALLAVTSHAPTNVGLDVATRIGELCDVFDSGLAQDDKTAALAMTAKTRIDIRSLHSRHVTFFGELCLHHRLVATTGLANATVCEVEAYQADGWGRTETVDDPAARGHEQSAVATVQFA